MAIDWNRFRFLAMDGDKSYWTYATAHVTRDMARMNTQLPRYPGHEFVPSKSGIAVIFHGKGIERIAATIDRLSDRILTEGMEKEVAGKGDPDGTA